MVNSIKDKWLEMGDTKKKDSNNWTMRVEKEEKGDF